MELQGLLERQNSHLDEFLCDRDLLCFLWQGEEEWEEGDRGRGNVKAMLRSLHLKAECCTPNVAK